MKYTVEYSEKARKCLRNLDQATRVLIKSWIDKNLVDCEDPRRFGKGLTANRSGQWRYRVGDYRILVNISGRQLLILVIDIDHRSRVYD